MIATSSRRHSNRHQDHREGHDQNDQVRSTGKSSTIATATSKSCSITVNIHIIHSTVFVVLIVADEMELQRAIQEFTDAQLKSILRQSKVDAITSWNTSESTDSRWIMASKLVAMEKVRKLI
jgi:hypothetical protein